PGDDRVVARPARVQLERPAVDALEQRDDVAGLRGVEGRLQARGIRDGLRRRAHRVGGEWPCGRLDRERLVDGAVYIGRVQLDLVGRVRLEVEDASRELRRHGAADDARRVDAEEVHRGLPGERSHRTVADADLRVAIVVAGDEQLDAE